FLGWGRSGRKCPQMSKPYAACQCWLTVGWSALAFRVDLEKTTPTTPRATTRPMISGNPHEPLLRRVVRPPPVRATRETFLDEEALPISGSEAIGPRAVFR